MAETSHWTGSEKYLCDPELAQAFHMARTLGMPLLIEAYRQLSRTAEDGIHGDPGKQTSARTCVVNGTGGSLSTTGTLVLVSED